MTLPKIVRFLGTTSAPDSTCPHCGASGMHVHSFVCEDGTTRAAMSGCIKLFPCSPVASEEARLRKKQEDYAKKGWSLNRADSEAMQAIQDFFDGVRDERSTMVVIKGAKARNQARFRR